MGRFPWLLLCSQHWHARWAYFSPAAHELGCYMMVNTKSNPHTGRSSLDQNQLEKIWKAKVENKCKLVSSTARQITYCGSHHLSRWSGQSSLFVSCVPSQWESGTRLLYAQQYNFQMVQQSMVRHTTFTTWWQFFTTKAYNTSPGGDTQHGICGRSAVVESSTVKWCPHINW